MMPTSPHHAVDLFQDAAIGKTPEDAALAKQQGALYDALRERLDAEGCRILNELDEWVGRYGAYNTEHGFQFGFRLGRSGLLEAAMNGGGS